MGPIEVVDASVSVVIVNYNAGDLLLQCIESVLFQTDQVLVVDNDNVILRGLFCCIGIIREECNRFEYC